VARSRQPNNTRQRRRRRASPSASVRLVEVTIDEIGTRGDGIATVDGNQIYIPCTAPGDVVKVELRGQRGQISELISQSPHRVPPPCPHFGSCGGCSLQHLDAGYYSDWKRGLVINALVRAGFEEGLIAPLVACEPSSRRRAEFSVFKNKAGLTFGFNARRSDRISEIESCSVLHPKLLSRLNDLKIFSSAVPAHSFDLGVMLCNNGLDINIACEKLYELSAAEISTLANQMRAVSCIRLSLNGEEVIEFEKPVIRFGAVQVSPPPGTFLQASQEAEDVLAALVLKNLGQVKRVADLFAGSGTFTFRIAEGAAVDAYDADRAAIAALDAATRGASLFHPIKAIVQNLYDRPVMAAELDLYDAIVFDPPRGGSKAQADEIALSKVPKVNSVSCNPVSFARDAAILRAGGYALSQVTPVDQFVYAPHVELVGVFTKG